MKYYICPECGKLYKSNDFDDIYYGLCWCKYVSYYWDNEYLQVEPQVDRTFVPCVQINKKWFNILNFTDNQKCRLSYFNAIPVKRRLK